ncbi:MAG: taurine catabolism dioxygenase TauD, partial [Chromatiales bacterium]|nr:taurine catabolism dioxygenase TauD [Chromatiales bacterium]
LPVFAIQDGHFTTHYSRTYVEAGQEVAHVPRVTDAQWEALDMLQALAHELCVTHRFEAGDIQFLNSHVTYHARSAYQDGDGPKRNLLRVWVSARDSRPLPTSHSVLFGDCSAGALRGGIVQEDGRRRPGAAAGVHA